AEGRLGMGRLAVIPHVADAHQSGPPPMTCAVDDTMLDLTAHDQ
ncbi:uncharacterized protein METZ01_LOCUS474113, partial [marine metagenome]